VVVSISKGAGSLGKKGAKPPQAFIAGRIEDDFARVAELLANETDKLGQRPEYPVRSVAKRTKASGPSGLDVGDKALPPLIFPGNDEYADD